MNETTKRKITTLEEAMHVLTDLQQTAQSVENYKDSFFADERGAARYDTEEIIETLLNLDLETQDKDVKETGYKANIANCDWIITQAKELKALLAYNSDRMIVLNKVRALSAIDTAMSSLRELQAYIESVKE